MNMTNNHLGSIMETIKSKVNNALNKKKKKSKKPYLKMDKSASVKVEIRSRKTRQLIDKTLKAADRPGKSSL
ncbi:Elongation factor P [Bienertia sinuspersici]